MQLLGFFVLAAMVVRSFQIQISDCGANYRLPAYTDISVECGTDFICLSILICPAMYSGYNESLLVLNNQFSDPACKGTVNANVTPPVVKYTFPLNMTNACGSVFVTTSAPGTGIFSDFSNIQTVNVSGVVRSLDLTTGTVTYNADLKYFYSCSYPLEYLVNNTRIDVSASSIAVRDNNGSFISTLSMSLYADVNYTSPMVIPANGIELRTKVYVQVQATNLTSQYFVLLDRCYASISPYPTNSTYFNLLFACNKDQMTSVTENGQSQRARFNFPAFRFLEQQNQTVSTYYLHCITRLCERSTCSTFTQCGKRRKRSVESDLAENGVSESTTLSTRLPIVTRAESVLAPKVEAQTGSNSDSSMGLGVAVGVLTLAVIVVLSVSAIFYIRLRNK